VIPPSIAIALGWVVPCDGSFSRMGKREKEKPRQKKKKTGTPRVGRRVLEENHWLQPGDRRWRRRASMAKRVWYAAFLFPNGRDRSAGRGVYSMRSGDGRPGCVRGTLLYRVCTPVLSCEIKLYLSGSRMMLVIVHVFRSVVAFAVVSWCLDAKPWP